MQNTIYIFIDEAGNFDFSSNGSKYFTLTSVSIKRSFIFDTQLSKYKYHLLKHGYDIESFHASEDSRIVRSKVFDIISSKIDNISIDSWIVEKSKVDTLQQDIKMFKYGMSRFISMPSLDRIDMALIIITDRIPINKKRIAVEKAIKSKYLNMLKGYNYYNIYHHESKSSYGLQIADYCNWAIYRKWSRGDIQYYNVIEKAIKNELNIFSTGFGFF